MAIEDEDWGDDLVDQTDCTEEIAIEMPASQAAIIRKKAKEMGWSEAEAARRFFIHMGRREAEGPSQ